MKEHYKEGEQDVPSGGGSASGRPASPSREIIPVEPDTAGPVREIPIGYPMDPEEFDRLKRLAERGTSEEVPADVDEDMAPQEDIDHGS